MRILIVGNGGREHVLAWKIRRDSPSSEIFSTRPNGGMLIDSQPVDISPGDIESITEWSVAQDVDLVVVGPEGPLASGLVDLLGSKGVPVFGPSKAASRIESSKIYSKTLMKQIGIPTADFKSFTNSIDALSYIKKRGGAMVVKASGLAAGKGAIVCGNVDDAARALNNIMTNSTFGRAGREVVIVCFRSFRRTRLLSNVAFPRPQTHR
jgi:phosphoribosylamine--glycine ligase